VQDNYVTQWGDPNYDNPEATGKPKPLPEGLKVMTEESYTVPRHSGFATWLSWLQDKNYAPHVGFRTGWPIGWDGSRAWPTHCYGMVGVGRNYSPDTGSGAELYTVIGHAPRHLDRNIALVGRVIEGMQHLSSLPRGSGALGFYTAEEAAKRTPITSVRVANDLPMSEQPRFEYLSTESETFAAYAETIANRRDPFFIVPAGGADICNIRVPVRRVAAKS
jgi:peptidylprolyl isomerase